MILHSDKRVRHEKTRKDSCKGRTETDGHLHSCPRHIRLISIRARMCSSRVVVRCISPPFSRVYCGRVAITHVMMQCHDAHGADTPFLIVFPPINANPFQDMSKKKKREKKRLRSHSVIQRRHAFRPTWRRWGSQTSSCVGKIADGFDQPRLFVVELIIFCPVFEEFRQELE